MIAYRVAGSGGVRRGEREGDGTATSVGIRNRAGGVGSRGVGSVRKTSGPGGSPGARRSAAAEGGGDVRGLVFTDDGFVCAHRHFRLVIDGQRGLIADRAARAGRVIRGKG